MRWVFFLFSLSQPCCHCLHKLIVGKKICGCQNRSAILSHGPLDRADHLPLAQSSAAPSLLRRRLTRVSSSLRANVLTIAPYAMPAPCPPVQAPPFHVKAVGRACPRCSLCRTSKHRGVAVGGREERRRRRPPLAAHTPPLERAGLPLQP